jgi:hypothetical protein
VIKHYASDCHRINYILEMIALAECDECRGIADMELFGLARAGSGYGWRPPATIAVSTPRLLRWPGLGQGAIVLGEMGSGRIEHLASNSGTNRVGDALMGAS